MHDDDVDSNISSVFVIKIHWSDIGLIECLVLGRYRANPNLTPHY